MTNILVRFYNTLIQKEYYVNRWKDIVEVMLDKGKGLIIGKLRTIQLIEANLQLLIQISIGMRNSENIEKNNNLSKYNFGSRRNYSIDTALLEKRLIYDASIKNEELHIHNMTDLEACYDRQLPKVSGLIQEAVGVDRKCIKMIMRVITKFRHHICTNHRISETYYGDDEEELAGNGQGNLFTGAAYQDQSCRGFKNLEQKDLGVKFRQLLSKKAIQRVAIEFVDDTDFYSNGDKGQTKMQRMINDYNKYYEITGGKISKDKSTYFCWQ